MYANSLYYVKFNYLVLLNLLLCLIVCKVVIKLCEVHPPRHFAQVEKEVPYIPLLKFFPILTPLF